MNLEWSQIEGYIPMIAEFAATAVGALVLVLLALFIAGKVKTLSMAAMRKAKVDETLVKFFGNMAKWGVLLLAGISLLGVFGIETASFAALLAAMGLAIGLAFQGTLSNLASGVMLLIFRPFRIGQFVKVAGEAGTVDEIGIFTTTLDTPDKRRVILPNSSVFGATIENVSHHSTRRVDVAVGTAYDADLEETKGVLLAAASKVPGVLQDPAPAVILTELGGSSIDWAIRAFCKSEDYWDVREKLLWDAKYALDRAQVGIPYPQMDIHLTGNSIGANSNLSDSAQLTQ